MPPVPDWADVIALDYSNQQLRKEMIESMRFWLKEYDIDGFRCDVAAMVPTDFWNDARKELDKTKKYLCWPKLMRWDLQRKSFRYDLRLAVQRLGNEIAKGRNRRRILMPT